MSQGLRVKRPFHVRRAGHGRKKLRSGETLRSPPAGRVPRISRLMALAIRFEQLLQDGVVADQAELARLGHVSRARLTQIMNLLNLAPDIQEEILFLSRAERGPAQVSEIHLRPITAMPNWRKQRRMWADLQASECL